MWDVETIVPKDFTREDVNVIRAKVDLYAARRDEAQSIIDFAATLSPEGQASLESIVETARGQVTMYDGKSLNQQKLVDTCIAAGVDK